MAALKACIGALLLVVLIPDAAAAQRGPIFLETGHWSYDAVRRLSGLGLAPPASDPAVAPMTRQHVRQVLEHATSLSEAGSGISDVVRGWLVQLNMESDTAGALSGMRIHAGWVDLAGQALAGDGYFPDEDWHGAAPVDRATAPVAGLMAEGHLAPWLSWLLHAGRQADDWRIAAASAGVAAGPIDVWAGRRRLHYGAGRGGGTVLGTGTAATPELTQRVLYSLDGGGLHTRQPFRYPGVLRFLGTGRVEVAGGRIPRSGRVESPWVAFGRFSMTPFSDRITLGVNRGAIFGGQGNPITAGRLAGLLIGLHGGDQGEFENQVIALTARVRPPLGPVPLEVFIEWGMDDTAGAIRDTPAFIAGADLAAVPGLDALSLGLEATRFPQSCCGNPIWYRSVFFRGSWADQGRLFAHPLGGHGTEVLGHGRLDLPQKGVMLRAEAFVRQRGAENLFAPARSGRSRGASLTLEYWLRSGTSVHVHGGFEDARAWNSHALAFQFSHSFIRSGR